MLDPDALNNAMAAYKRALDGLTFASNRINITAPSPVYPDLVALPLLSKERCYGPWVSSQNDAQSKVYSNIPGRVEFVKDENLAPWNFNGYQLMNEAALLQTQFSNSLLLMSERGGFSVPSAPSGIFLGKALAEAGPLVTNISVDIGTQGVQTTYKLDLYTSSFGKLAKQKEHMIANISRERQKLKDERNALVRKGIGKNQKNVNLNQIYDALRNQSIGNSYFDRIISPTQRYQSYSDTIVFQSTPSTSTTNVTSPSTGYSATGGTFDGTPTTVTDTKISASFMPQSEVFANAENFPDRAAANNAYNNSAAASLSDLFSPVSHQPNHPNMPSVNSYNTEYYG